VNVPGAGLFREEALQHYLQAEDGHGLVRVSPPWTWAVLWIVLAALFAALVAGVAGSVEINSRGLAILRPVGGVRTLTSQVSGTIASVDVHSGQLVKAGAQLLRIDAPALQGQLLEADRQLAAVRSDFQAATDRQDQYYRQQEANIRSRIQNFEELVASQQNSSARIEAKLSAMQKLTSAGLVSRISEADTKEAVAQAKRDLNMAQQNLEQARQELASLGSQRQDELWQRQQILSSALSRRDSLAIQLRQTRMLAPQDGVVEALLVQPGEVVQPGETVGKLIPENATMQVVSFLPEKDRAFVKVGDEVRLELQQLPYAEYGTLQARVVRVGDDLASPYEIREALGDEQKITDPTYRIELRIVDASAATAAKVKLRTGMLMNARFTLRRQRPITFVLDPLRRWFR